MNISLALYFSFPFFICVAIHLCVGTQTHVPVKVSGGRRVSCSVALSLAPWSQGLSLNLKHTIESDWPATSLDLPISAIINSGVPNVRLWPIFTWALGI